MRRIMQHNPWGLVWGPAAAWMSSPWGQQMAQAMAERLTVWLNHVLAAEPVATQRLQRQVGRTLLLQLDAGVATSATPPLRWQVSPAGLLEWQPVAGAASGAQAQPSAADLTITLDVSDPARLLRAWADAGVDLPMQVQGDGGLAADISWLQQHVRWDVAGDVEQVLRGVLGPGLGPTAAPIVAAQVERLGRGVRSALARLLARAPGMSTPPAA